MNDDAIREEVLHELNCNPRITSSDIAVTVKEAAVAPSAVHELGSHVGIPSTEVKVTAENGWVTLEGNVDWQYRKALAESLVKKLKGVMGLDNHIEIKPKVSPEEVKDKIEEALRRSAELDAGRIVVEVVGATVKLEGAVRSWAERSDAEQAAWSALGTANVENHLDIKPY
jgi:osmotically-inducible protein OsmY